MKFRRDVSDWTPEQKRAYDKRAKWIIGGFIGLQASIVCINQMFTLSTQQNDFEQVANDTRIPDTVREEYRQASEDVHDAQLPYLIVLETELVGAAGILIYSTTKRKGQDSPQVEASV